jgi:peptide/nickel transport system substrate-binding protein
MCAATVALAGRCGKGERVGRACAGARAGDARIASLSERSRMANVLRVGVDIEMNSLDPHNLVAGAARRVAPNICPGLLRVDRDLRIAPSLGESWETRDDGRQVTLRLVPGVTFHTGRKLTAQSVVENFERILAPDSPSYQRPDYQVVERVEALHARTVRFALREPFAPFLGLLANNTGMTDVKALASRDARTQPIGAGPYELVRWVPGEQLELRAVADYHRPDVSRTELVQWRFTADVRERTDQLLDEATQLICAPDPTRLDALRRAGFVVDVVAGHGPSHLTFNCATAPFSDRRARLAVAHAVNRPALLERLFGGLGTASCTPFAPGSPWYVELTAPVHDPERGRWLLREAGFGQRIRLTLPVNGPSGAIMGAAIAQDLAMIGIDLDVKPYPNPLWWPGVYTSSDWQIIFQTWTPMPDPDQVLGRRYHSRGRFNSGQYVSARMDQHLSEGRAQLDPARRGAAYAAAQQLILDDVPSVYLFHEPAVDAWSPRVRGYCPHPMWATEIAEVSVG